MKKEYKKNNIVPSAEVREAATGLRELFTRQANGEMVEVDDEQVVDLALELLQRRFARGETLSSPRAVRSYLQARLARLEHEVFAVLWLDNRHRVLDFNELFRGTIDAASVYPREVVKAALSFNAAACILVHNHPSGIAEPSRADRAMTERLKSVLELVDVRVLDHIVVGEECVSFAERGLL